MSGGRHPRIGIPWAAGGESQLTGVDIGSVFQAGSTSYNAGAYTVSGAGVDIWSTADAFHFAYKALSGDGTITARAVSITNTHAWTKGGLMIRESLNANSIFANIAISPSQGCFFQIRATTGGSATQVGGASATAPYWLRLVRSGSTFTAYRSADGSSWTEVGSTTVSMATNVYVGLAVTSLSESLCTTVFDGVTMP